MTDSSPDGKSPVEPVASAVAKLEQTLAQPNGNLDRSRLADLIDQIKESADKLAVDQTSPRRLEDPQPHAARAALRLQGLHALPLAAQGDGVRLGPHAGPTKPAYQQAVDFGRAMAEQNWLVVTGAASGIMEAGHVGAGRENSMGLNIMLPFEQYANPIIAGDPKLVHMKYFFTRKLMFVKECDAVCLLPGGFGTLDEGLEVLTLLQTGKRDMVPVVLLDAPGGTFWSEFAAIRRAASCWASGMISPEDLSLYKLTDSVDDGGRRDPAVLPRLPQHAVREEQARAAAARSAHAPNCWRRSTSSSPTSSPAASSRSADRWPRNRTSRTWPHLPRLVFHFNRRSLGPPAAVDRRDQSRQHRAPRRAGPVAAGLADARR